MAKIFLILYPPFENSTTRIAILNTCIFFLGLGIADSDDDEDDAADMMDDDDTIFLPEKSANNRRIQPLIPDDFGKQTLIFIGF